MRDSLSRLLGRFRRRSALGWIALAVGIVLVVLGWYGIAGQSTVAKQLPYLASGTIPGSALVLAGLIMLAGPHDDRQTRQRVADLHAALLEQRPSAEASADGLVASARGRTYHRAGCTLAQAAAPVDARAISERDLTPCPVCDPAPIGGG